MYNPFIKQYKSTLVCCLPINPYEIRDLFIVQDASVYMSRSKRIQMNPYEYIIRHTKIYRTIHTSTVLFISVASTIRFSGGPRCK